MCPAPAVDKSLFRRLRPSGREPGPRSASEGQPLQRLASTWLTLAHSGLGVVTSANRGIGRLLDRVQLRVYAAQVGRDPDNARWVAETRSEIEAGIPEDHFIGRDELLARKRALDGVTD